MANGKLLLQALCMCLCGVCIIFVVNLTRRNIDMNITSHLVTEVKEFIF